MTDNKKRIFGFLLVLSGAGFWGIGGTVSQYLFQEEGITVGWLVSVRLLLAGMLMIILASFLRGKLPVFAIWKDKNARIQVITFGILGMLGVQYTYMASINYGNAAVATLLQYLAPVFVLAYLTVRKLTKLNARNISAVIMALSGTFLLLTDGSLYTLAVSGRSIFWGILSGVALAFYTLYAGPLLKQWGSLYVIGWAMLIGGTAIGAFHLPQPFDISGWSMTTLLYLGFVIIFGTMLGFWFFLESLKYLDVQETSLLGSMEPLAAIVTAVLWLQIPFGWYQMFGTAIILVMVIYLSIAKEAVPPAKKAAA
ncbi:EamA family transporter [Alkalicoccus daliensis]|uniref:Permease of the drug/metabolite transporter (DMT) superfamily n=1 Tax=Alkalicoccus daliensis TaxID=745820 RepID=A0A1G9ZF74_9BACI|nr:DMT family transporter [Alkalicoccus daliensis]SDN19641.1 Permease of the drug/metabolite transporter (DMT) superfamily [Alkalicoccus daliensis]